MKKNSGTERTEVFQFGEAWGFSTNFITANHGHLILKCSRTEDRRDARPLRLRIGWQGDAIIRWVGCAEGIGTSVALEVGYFWSLVHWDG